MAIGWNAANATLYAIRASSFIERNLTSISSPSSNRSKKFRLSKPSRTTAPVLGCVIPRKPRVKTTTRPPKAASVATEAMEDAADVGHSHFRRCLLSWLFKRRERQLQRRGEPVWQPHLRLSHGYFMGHRHDVRRKRGGDISRS